MRRLPCGRSSTGSKHKSSERKRAGTTGSGFDRAQCDHTLAEAAGTDDSATARLNSGVNRCRVSIEHLHARIVLARSVREISGSPT